MGTVIAERRLRVAGQPELDVRLRIGAPQPYPDGPLQNYYCAHQIIGLGRDGVRHTGGVDGVQAWSLASALSVGRTFEVRRKTAFVS